MHLSFLFSYPERHLRLRTPLPKQREKNKGASVDRLLSLLSLRTGFEAAKSRSLAGLLRTGGKEEEGGEMISFRQDL